ncbi:hypothetical protein IW140_000172 [Coemansia sp. RSA 1813]|nr:hypothetical protein LPJ74_001603 [Coemansia sp. RSA 1843]KAJ2213035.1 hypothetical protein EV179_004183 [Coemansia sp. RSA 487]KAJ2573530.1 hypothetical protein IW140_000172 [Coemansia sp. RSA 1813]
MAISAALGMGGLRVSSTSGSTTNSLLRRHHVSAATPAAAAAGGTNVPYSVNSNADDTDLSDFQPAPLPMVQYASDKANAQVADNPMVSRILQNNTAIPWGCEATTSPFASKSQLPKATKAHTASSVKTGSAANIGGIRRALKRAHTPEGLVLHYETRLRAFLGVEDNNDDNADGEDSENNDEGDWLVVEQEDGMFSPIGYKAFLDDDMVVLEKALGHLRNTNSKGSPSSSKDCSSPEIVAGIKNSLVAQWTVKDSFTRMIVHTMCRYYGLVSFSDTTGSGHTALHICHPRFFNDQDVVSLPSPTFHQFIFSK